MNINLFINSNDVRVLNKGLTAVGTDIPCELTDVCSVSDPVLLLNYSDSYIGANYLYISKWGRYYYINEKEIVNGNQIRLSAHIDVLMSFKNAILSSDVIAERSASRPDPYVVDNMVGDKGTIQVYERRSGTTPFGYTGNNYVLMVGGR